MHCSRCPGSCSSSCRTCIVELILQGSQRLGTARPAAGEAGARKRRGSILSTSPRGLDPCSRHQPPPPPLTLPAPPVQNWVTTPSASLLHQDLCGQGPASGTKNGTGSGRSHKTLPCFRLPHAVLEQSGSFLVSEGCWSWPRKPLQPLGYCHSALRQPCA